MPECAKQFNEAGGPVEVFQKEIAWLATRPENANFFIPNDVNKMKEPFDAGKLTADDGDMYRAIRAGDINDDALSSYLKTISPGDPSRRAFSDFLANRSAAVVQLNFIKDQNAANKEMIAYVDAQMNILFPEQEPGALEYETASAGN